MSNKQGIVFKIDELKDGEMKQATIDGTDVLVARVNGKFHALAAHCTHYGAPLADGVLNGERIVCPWHHACFNVTTGDREEPPALDALPCFDVKVDGENVVVSFPDPVTDRRTPTMVKRDPSNKRVFAIIGGGAAGYSAAQTLREDGFGGRVVMITREDKLPYDRPNLSKEYLQGKAESEWMPLRPDEFYAEHDIEVLRHKEVVNVDSANKIIGFKDGDTLQYDSLLIATGGVPRRVDTPGSDLKNVFLLRSFNDADAIIAKAKEATNAVVIGASFIGMETAASLVERKVSVTVVAPDDVPFKKTLGPEIGKLLQQVHQDKGVKFKLGSRAARFEGNDAVRAVVLNSGEYIEADLVIIGVGVKPATDFLQGIPLHKDRGVIVDKHFRVADGLYASGDIAWFPSAQTGELQRIEHWRTALQQGRIAAHNMSGKTVEYDGVPFFWTNQFDAALVYVGRASGWDEIIYHGGVSARDFLAFYLKDNRVQAVAGMTRDRDMAALEELMRLNKMPSVERLKTGKVDFLEVMNGA